MKKLFDKIKYFKFVINNYETLVNTSNENIEKLKEKNKIIENYKNDLISYESELVIKEFKIKELIMKNQEVELRRRKFAGATGGLTKQCNKLLVENNEKTEQIKILHIKLKSAIKLIQHLENEIRRLKRKPTMKELMQYEITHKSPRK